MSEQEPPRSGSRWEPGAGRPPAYQAEPTQPVAAATSAAEPGPPGTATAADPPTLVPSQRNRFARWRGWPDRSPRRAAAAAAALGVLLGGIGGFAVGHAAADDGSGRLDGVPAIGDGDGDDPFPDDVTPDGHRAPPGLGDGRPPGPPPGAGGSGELPEDQDGTAT